MALDSLEQNSNVDSWSSFTKLIDKSLTSGYADRLSANQFFEQKSNVDSWSSYTNYINKSLTSRKDISLSKESLKQNFTEKLLYEFKACIYTEELEFGFIGNTTKLIEKYIKLNKDLTLNSLSKFGLDNFNNIKIIYAILHTFAHLRYNLVEPIGPTFALAVLSHKNIEIKDFSIQCFEIWNDKKTLSYLKSIKIEEEWLNSYFKSVITSIELS